MLTGGGCVPRLFFWDRVFLISKENCWFFLWNFPLVFFFHIKWHRTICCCLSGRSKSVKSLLQANYCFLVCFSQMNFFVFLKKNCWFLYDFWCFRFRINWRLIKCGWLSGRSENNKSLLNAKACVSRLIFWYWFFRISKNCCIFYDNHLS